jgi:hypothetical protein
MFSTVMEANGRKTLPLHTNLHMKAELFVFHAHHSMIKARLLREKDTSVSLFSKDKT